MHYCDDDLRRFEAEGAAALPPAAEQGFVEHDGARIWFSIYGAGTPVLLLHGGLATAATGAISLRRFSRRATASCLSTVADMGAVRAISGLTAMN